MVKFSTPLKKTIIILLTVSIVPIGYYLWLTANPALVNNLEQSTTLSQVKKATEGNIITSSDNFQPMSLFEQVSAVIGGFVFKPIHMLLCLVILWAMRREKSTDLVALRWGLLFFLLGEAFCAVNYLIFNHKSNFSEFLHSYGMVVGFAFTFYAVFEGLDKRLIQFTAKNKKCAASELCGKCIKSQPVPCGARRIILLVLPVMLIISLIPLAVELQANRYQTDIFGTIYTYDWPLIYQLFEARFTPVLALLMFACAWLVMFIDRRSPIPDTARILAAIGFGAVSFGILRFTLKTMFLDNIIWADYWEELAELLFVFAVGAVLVLFLQRFFQETFPDNAKISILNILKPENRSPSNP